MKKGKYSEFRLMEMPVEKLENLLATEFSTRKGFSPDLEFIDRIIGVINKKEKHREKPPCSTTHWEEFLEYMWARCSEDGEAGGRPSGLPPQGVSQFRCPSR